MDCERFDTNLMDALFEELDEVTSAAMKRHADSCDRCAELESGMRATLDVGQLPLEQPSDDLEARILAAAFEAQRGEPWYRKVVRSLSWAGSYAMRPQFAMAALLVIVLGSSVLLLRAKPDSVAVTPAQDGQPESTPAGPQPALTNLALQPVPEEPIANLDKQAPSRKPAASGAQLLAENAADAPKDRPKLAEAELEDIYERGLRNYTSGSFVEAERDVATVNSQGGGNAPNAALYEARSVRAHSGCKSAVTYYDNVRNRFGATAASADATWEQADCHQMLGQSAAAIKLWTALASNAQYRARAVNALNARGQAGTAGRPIAAKRRSAPPPPAAGANATQGGGSKGSPKASVNETDVGFDAAAY